MYQAWSVFISLQTALAAFHHAQSWLMPYLSLEDLKDSTYIYIYARLLLDRTIGCCQVQRNHPPVCTMQQQVCRKKSKSVSNNNMSFQSNEKIPKPTSSLLSCTPSPAFRTVLDVQVEDCPQSSCPYLSTSPICWLRHGSLLPLTPLQG